MSTIFRIGQIIYTDEAYVSFLQEVSIPDRFRWVTMTEVIVERIGSNNICETIPSSWGIIIALIPELVKYMLMGISVEVGLATTGVINMKPPLVGDGSLIKHNSTQLKYYTEGFKYLISVSSKFIGDTETDSLYPISAYKKNMWQQLKEDCLSFVNYIESVINKTLEPDIYVFASKTDKIHNSVTMAINNRIDTSPNICQNISPIYFYSPDEIEIEMEYTGDVYTAIVDRGATYNLIGDCYPFTIDIYTGVVKLVLPLKISTNIKIIAFSGVDSAIMDLKVIVIPRSHTSIDCDVEKTTDNRLCAYKNRYIGEYTVETLMPMCNLNDGTSVVVHSTHGCINVVVYDRFHCIKCDFSMNDIRLMDHSLKYVIAIARQSIAILLLNTKNRELYLAKVDIMADDQIELERSIEMVLVNKDVYDCTMHKNGDRISIWSTQNAKKYYHLFDNNLKEINRFIGANYRMDPHHTLVGTSLNENLDVAIWRTSWFGIDYAHFKTDVDYPTRDAWTNLGYRSKNQGVKGMNIYTIPHTTKAVVVYAGEHVRMKGRPETFDEFNKDFGYAIGIKQVDRDDRFRERDIVISQNELLYPKIIFYKEDPQKISVLWIDKSNIFIKSAHLDNSYMSPEVRLTYLPSNKGVDSFSALGLYDGNIRITATLHDGGKRIYVTDPSGKWFFEDVLQSDRTTISVKECNLEILGKHASKFEILEGQIKLKPTTVKAKDFPLKIKLKITSNNAIYSKDHTIYEYAYHGHKHFE